MKAKVNGRFDYQLTSSYGIDFINQNGAFFQIQKEGKILNIELLEYNIRAGIVRLAMEGYIFEVEMMDSLNELITLIRKKTGAISGNEIVVAPIPGLIKEVNKEIKSVDRGEALIVLEAMKMENTIQAPVAADHIEYHVEPGDQVVKGQKLVTLKT